MPFANPLHDPAKRLIRFPAAQWPDSWPKAPSQYAFIFEAINIAGASLCAGEWTGKELLAILWLESPWGERLRSRVWRPNPPVPRSIGSPRPLSRSKPEPIEHRKDWQAATLHKDWEANNLAVSRLNRTVEWIAQKCRDGDLTSFWRMRIGGGAVRPMMAHEWNVDAPISTFVTDGGHKRYCPELQNPGPWETYVFFERRQLLDILERDPEAPLIVAREDLARLSPYLRLAVHIAMKRKYFEGEKIDKAAARSAEIEAAWKDFLPDVPMTPAAVTSLTKLIGFPDRKAIERGQSGGEAAKRGKGAKG